MLSADPPTQSSRCCEAGRHQGEASTGMTGQLLVFLFLISWLLVVSQVSQCRQLLCSVILLAQKLVVWGRYEFVSFCFRRRQIYLYCPNSLCFSEVGPHVTQASLVLLALLPHMSKGWIHHHAQPAHMLRSDQLFTARVYVH